MELPNSLRLGLERELRGATARRKRDAAALSTAYRETGRPSGPLSPEAAAAYAAWRMPATYAAVAAALGALAAGLPEFKPTSQLDVGAGTGAALWAAAERWERLDAATLIEREGAMIALGQRLAAGGGATLRGASWRSVDVTDGWDAVTHDLVTAAYLLGELPEVAWEKVVAKLWERAGGALVLVEPGTPRGWATIRAAREQLRSLGATIVAPCPHQNACPLPPDDWCHFAQRLSRTRAQREAKGASLGYEDEKYSYLAMARQGGVPIGARVLRNPNVRPGRIELALCAEHGLTRTLVTRGAGSGWRRARDLRWGDALPPGALEEP